ncbi:hypothetical protein DL95DRAFT_416867 [Leptodontidium sp. 2 PMI_412]|nr:hypothetical protein DL95DRAFT_416867 [Leptodontidium sp. 2 PMI_412]
MHLAYYATLQALSPYIIEFEELYTYADYGLSDDQSELSDPPDSVVSGETDDEDKEAEWYELSSDSEDEVEDVDPPEEPLSAQITTKSKGSGKPSIALICGLIVSSSIKREFSIGARIRAVTILNDRLLIKKIIEVTGIGKSRIYSLVATVSIEVIRAVLKAITKNSTTRGFSTVQISKEGYFSYDKKGPCHVWEPETAQEKRDRKADLDARNALIERAHKAK